MPTIRVLRTVIALCLMALPAAAQVPDLRAPDVLRMRAFDAHLGLALREAFATGDAASLVVLTDALAGGVPRAGILEPSGDWNCRTIKLGSLTPIVAYGAFRCRIVATGPGIWTLTKLTGSQRVTGTLANLPDGRVQFTGVGHVGTEPAVSYADLPPKDQTPMEPNQTTADVGLFEQVSPTRARLMLPAPLLESRFDILYLTR